MKIISEKQFITFLTLVHRKYLIQFSVIGLMANIDLHLRCNQFTTTALQPRQFGTNHPFNIFNVNRSQMSWVASWCFVLGLRNRSVPTKLEADETGSLVAHPLATSLLVVLNNLQKVTDNPPIYNKNYVFLFLDFNKQ